MARPKITVALGGDGSDELFAGYDTFHALRPARWYDRLVPRPLCTRFFEPWPPCCPFLVRT
jgi:asparagine synthetase B (glutamine-hydrolysing)